MEFLDKKLAFAPVFVQKIILNFDFRLKSNLTFLTINYATNVKAPDVEENSHLFSVRMSLAYR